MIIECQTCHARFRLDESRIKGRGARVKCRKCGDSILVLKDGASPPPPPGGDGFFDLGSAVRDSAGENRVAPPPVGNLIPFPAPSRPEEPVAKEPSPNLLTPAEPERDEVDLAFDRVLSAPPEPRPELDLGALTLDFGPEGKLDLPPAAEPEPPFGEPPAVVPSAEFRGEGGFLISDSDTLDFLQEKHPETRTEVPPMIGDISLEISSSPVDEGDSFLREPDAPPSPPGDWKSPSPPKDLAAPPSDENFLEGNITPPSAPVIEIPPYREEESAPAPPVESAVRRTSSVPESQRPSSSVGPAVAVVLVVLLAAGGYLGLTTSGRNMLEGAIPGVTAIWGGKPGAPAASKYDLRNVIGYYETGSASQKILVIKGQVVNLSTVEKSGIRVSAALLDNTDAVLAQQAVYAGNMLAGEAIRKGDRDSLSKALGNRFGEGLSNMHVGPGKAIPFMVVFFDAPANMDSYRLEGKDGE
jgi:predicted Zn finger-like uncharacterized protein